MRVGTLNLLHGRSVEHGGVEVADLRAAARALDVDALGLQEVDRNLDRSGTVDQTAEVAAALGAADWRFVPTLSAAPETGQLVAVDPGRPLESVSAGYGIGLVSRFPVRSWAIRRFGAAPVAMPLMVPGRSGLTQVPDEPRAAVAAVLDTPDGVITVVTAHLSFVPGWNVAQLRVLARWIRTLPAPRVLAGDLNLPGPLPGWVTGWPMLARVATYPSWRPRVQFDHVLGSGIRPDAASAVRSIRLPVSDHCGLVVDLAPHRPRGAGG